MSVKMMKSYGLKMTVKMFLGPNFLRAQGIQIEDFSLKFEFSGSQDALDPVFCIYVGASPLFYSYS